MRVIVFEIDTSFWKFFETTLLWLEMENKSSISQNLWISTLQLMLQNKGKPGHPNTAGERWVGTHAKEMVVREGRV